MSATGQMIPAPRPSVQLRKKSYGTNDIIDLIVEVERDGRAEMVDFARQFPPSRDGLRRLYDYVDRHFRYVEDPDFSQWVQMPAYLNDRRVGDCKSFTIFISATLHNMGIDRELRLVSYSKGRPYHHIYPVAILPDGERVPMDVVYKKLEGGAFGTEKLPIMEQKIIELAGGQGLARLGNLSNEQRATVQELEASLVAMDAALADIPDNIVSQDGGDLTQMTEGQFSVFVEKQRFDAYIDHATSEAERTLYLQGKQALEAGGVAGIGSLAGSKFGAQVQRFIDRANAQTAPAFAPINLVFPTVSNPQMAGIKDLFNKIGNGFKKLFTKFVNWAFKGPVKKMGSFYLFQFMQQPPRNAEARRRYYAQRKSMQWFAQKGKLDHSKMMSLMRVGIKEQYGKEPEQLLAEGGASQIGGMSAILAGAVKIFPAILNLVKKVISVFGKKKAGSVDIRKGDASDTDLFDDYSNSSSSTTTNRPSGGASTHNDHSPYSGGEGQSAASGNGGGGMAVAAAAAAALFLFN